ncbi:Survival protein SurE-like phosphatase/nucleotidase [Penicillium cosmopolitanum]|uniref:Survival protein SurE-like phosphatase/nucleotidase n=1 Tax=Penicillium cosmopolitanum TaxID=1131564 RepID=A0A9W9SDB6_9EURO|nr:Survival protein SurE-like phosphatase/nucleotidase [Penicillium cosmopolitanum]KAJ5375915.1 Survival protein SurE-like phosphatase/nucleotidase [Penicillium cosmopolitanum]
MRVNVLSALVGSLALAKSSLAVNIISSNDDGWAEVNIRAFFDALTEADHSVVVAAPAENQSGKGSSQGTPTTLDEACEFNSCPSGSPAVGHNASEPRLNYVNSYPATSMKYGINSIGPQFFDGSPRSCGRGTKFYISGTAGAATYAAHYSGIPAIAFSGATGSQTAWNASSTYPNYSQVYADAATNLTNHLIAAGKPYLPNDIWLNVNFPSVSDSECTKAEDISFVLSRIHVAVPLITPDDVTTCGGDRLPSEIGVSLTSGCYASVSVGMAGTKGDANATMQEIVLKKFSNLLTCLP